GLGAGTVELEPQSQIGRCTKHGKFRAIADLTLHFDADAGVSQRLDHLVVIGLNPETDAVVALALSRQKIGIAALAGYRLHELEGMAAATAHGKLEHASAVPQRLVVEHEPRRPELIESPG